VNKVVEDALSAVADSVIVNYLRTKQQQEILGATPQICDALHILYKSFEGVVGYAHD
jgi:hypothetical protein